MSDTEKNNAPKPVTMDAKKFVQRLNSGAQAKIHLIGEKVKEMGFKVGKTYELATLDAESLIFEDKDDNSYHLADIKKNGDKLSIENIRPIKVIEDNAKSGDYDKTLAGLVEAVGSGDTHGADKLFNLLCGGFKFRSSVVPESGVVRLRDGSTRKISVADRIVTEDKTKRIIESLRKALSDDVQINEGRVVSATFTESDKKIRIPINDWTRCRLRANEMRSAAASAYKSPAFSSLIKNCAALVSDGQLKEAVQLARPLLEEQQEFCTLNRAQFTELVENALATHCEFNPFIARDTSKLLYRANLKINRDAIVESWKKAAQIAKESAIYEDATELDDATDTGEFEGEYEGFLDGVFNEGDDVTSSKAKVYRMCLQILASVLSNVEASQEDAEALTQMAEALASNPDHSTVMQAEELLAQIADDIIDAVETLHTFDEKGEEGAEPEEGEMGEEPVELPDLEGEMGGEEGFGAPAGEGAEAEGGLPSELGGEGEEGPAGEAGDEGGEEEKKGKEPVKGLGELPESKLRSMPINERREYAIKKHGHVFIEDENIEELESEIDSWEINGSQYILRDGEDDSIEQMNRFVKRCDALGPNAMGLRSRFETLRENIMVYGDVLGKHDPYAETLKKRGKKVGNLTMDNEYRGWVTTESELPLEKAEGKGVAAKDPKESDGTDSGGAKFAGKGKVAEGSSSTEKPEGKGVADKKKSSEGVPSGASNRFGGNLKKASTSESTDSFLNTLEEQLEALDSPEGEGVATKSVKDSDGRGASNSAASGAAEHEGDPLEGAEGEGVATKSTKESDGRGATNSAAEGAPEHEDLPLEKADGEGVARKSATDSDGRSGGTSFGESQYKWSSNASKRRQSGRRKSKLFPKNKELDEEVEVTVSGAALDGQETSYAAKFPEGDPQEIIGHVMDAMSNFGEEPEAELGGEGEMGDEGELGSEIPAPSSAASVPDLGSEGGLGGEEEIAPPADGGIESEIDAALAEPDDVDLGSAPSAPGTETAPKPKAPKKPSASE